MRRSAVLSLLAGAAILASACSPDKSSGPTDPSLEATPDKQAEIGLRCRDNGLIVLQLAAILSSKPPARLYQQSVVKFAMIEVALLTRKKPQAQKLALELIDWLVDNRANLINPNTQLTQTRLANVIDAILCIVGLPPTGVQLGPNTGIGVVPANNPDPVVIRTPQGNAGLLVPPNYAPDKNAAGNTIPGVVVTVTGNLTTGLNTPLDQYGQTVDLTASEEVTWRNEGVVVAFCVSTDTELAIFNRLRIGHEGGLGPFFGLIEILPVADEDDVETILGNVCDPEEFGSNSGFGALRNFASRLLLPAPLHASAAAIAVTGGVGGTTKRFSPFRAVDPQLFVEAASATSQSGTEGAPVAEPPAVRVSTDSGHPVPGIDVTFEVTVGEGEVDPTEVTTGNDGVAATESWIINFGENTVVATPVPPIPGGGEEDVHEAPPITFVPPSVSFTAEGTENPIEYGSDGYTFIRIGAAGPSGSTTNYPAGQWFLPRPAFTPGDAWSVGPAPFGESAAGCSIFTDHPVATAWAAASGSQANPNTGSGLLVRRAFTTPENFQGRVLINVAVDNDIQVYLDGQDVTQVDFEGETNDDAVDGYWDPFISPFQPHGGCARRGDGTFAIPGSMLAEGTNHLIAVFAHDWGGASYLDLEVTLDFSE